ncbi:HNH endonuclease signature motif containing protein [Kitasatospora sp. NPDC048538]|uniref:HNH endonuclease n=1 Tax=unclassified Kitasatospora TaxID=2633591 RepID=UPI0033CEC1E6
MEIGGITRSGILQAIAEHDRLGEELFRVTYGYRAVSAHLLVHEGRHYDSKAIAGVAHLFDGGEALKQGQFSGGPTQALNWLEREGFALTKPPRTFVRRVGSLRPAMRKNGPAPHRPLLVLWAIGQALAGAPRERSWTETRAAIAPLLEKYGEVRNGAQAAHFPFAALVGDDLWEIEPTGSGDAADQAKPRRPTLDVLNRFNPKAGFPEADHQLIQAQPEVAAEAAAGLILRYFYPLPDDFLADLGLRDLLTNRWADALRPLIGERFEKREAIWHSYGGERMAGIGSLGDGILSTFSKDKGPYDDGRLADSDWIAYVGDGLKGDQRLVDGNKALAEHQAAQRPLRYWHKPLEGDFTFETWAVVVQRRLRWGQGTDKEWRREFIWILAPVPSPLRETWPHDVEEALANDTGELYDETTEYQPGDIDSTARHTTESDAEAYRRLTEAAEHHRARRKEAKRPTKVDRHVRSTSARAAVIRRSGGRCENARCAGHPTELTTAGEPILQVDHVHDLSKGGPDVPWNMIALCPNCHALKTYGQHQEKLRRELKKTAQHLHTAALDSSTT